MHNLALGADWLVLNCAQLDDELITLFYLQTGRECRVPLQSLSSSLLVSRFQFVVTAESGTRVSPAFSLCLRFYVFPFAFRCVPWRFSLLVSVFSGACVDLLGLHAGLLTRDFVRSARLFVRAHASHAMRAASTPRGFRCSRLRLRAAQ